MDEEDREAKAAHEAASAVIYASMEVRLHGIPRDRDARKRLEAVLGPIQPARVDNGEATGEYDPLRYGLR